MNLWILSDLHADHGGEFLEPPAGADIAVVSGDVCDDSWLARASARLPTIFVAGNHEFYGWEYQERLVKLRSITGLIFLENDDVVVRGVRFIGATLWTDYRRCPLAAEAARWGMKDHRYIKWQKEPHERFLPSHAAQLHGESRHYIAYVLAEHFSEKNVVVTHHAPHAGSVHPHFASSHLSSAYYSDLTDIIMDGQPTLWVHGHMHDNVDYMVGATRILCNPRGYPGQNPNFNPGLMVAV